MIRSETRSHLEGPPLPPPTRVRSISLHRGPQAGYHATGRGASSRTCAARVPELLSCSQGRRFGYHDTPGAHVMPQKILPHLWFDKEAKEAAELYTSIFPRSRVTNVTTLRDTPGGDCDVVSFELADFKLMSISAGPLFKF